MSEPMTRRPRASSIAVRVAVACFAWLTLLVAGAVPAWAGQDAVDVHAQCVWDNPDGTLTAVWSYTNHTDQAIDIPVGPDNRMTTSPDDQGQPTHFLPGEHLNAWVVQVTSGSLAWHLLTSGDVANNGSPRCATNPVSVVGDWRAGALGLLVLLPVAYWAMNRRFRAVLALPAAKGGRSG